MVSFKTLSLAGVLAASASLVNGLGCYGAGPIFADLRVQGGTVDAAILDFCTNIVPRNFAPLQEVTHCYPYPDNSNRMNMALKNTDSVNNLFLSLNDCFHNFEIERGACTHGSEQQYNSFWYQVDPNDGGC